MPANEDALVACGERPGLRIVRPANLEVIDKRIAACRFLLDRLFLLGRVGLGGILFLVRILVRDLVLFLGLDLILELILLLRLGFFGVGRIGTRIVMLQRGLQLVDSGPNVDPHLGNARSIIVGDHRECS